MPNKTLTESEVKNLIDKSFEAMKYAYCPYSNFPVGAALLCEDGTIYTGCNVENASYPLTVCAEKTAISKAVSHGHKRFTAIAVCSTLTETVISPCGSCRQVIAEFGNDWDVYMTKYDRTYVKKSIKELLPVEFTIDHLLRGPKVTMSGDTDLISNGVNSS